VTPQQQFRWLLIACIVCVVVGTGLVTHAVTKFLELSPLVEPNPSEDRD